MATITLDDALETGIRAVAAPDEDLNAFIAAMDPKVREEMEREGWL